MTGQQSNTQSNSSYKGLICEDTQCDSETALFLQLKLTLN